ncbi:MAG: hypothetical protein U0457_11030 [Candidatus Sericytochromatia bacterium]
MKETKETDALFSKFLIKKGYLTTDKLMKCIDFQTNLDRRNWIPIGDILLRYNYITEEKLNHAKNEFNKENESSSNPNNNFRGTINSKEQDAEIKNALNKIQKTSNDFRTTNLSNKNANEIKSAINNLPQTNKPNLPVQTPPTVNKVNLVNPQQNQLVKPILPNTNIQPNQNLGRITLGNSQQNDTKNIQEEVKKYATPNKTVPPPPPVAMQNATNNQVIRKPIGEILIEKGIITRYQLSNALQYQSSLNPTNYKPIGEVMIEMGFLSKTQLDDALKEQPEKTGNAIGEILKKLGFINEAQLAAVLSQQHSVSGKPILIGELLVQHGFISPEQLDQALKVQKSINNKAI